MVAVLRMIKPPAGLFFPSQGLCGLTACRCRGTSAAQGLHAVDGTRRCASLCFVREKTRLVAAVQLVDIDVARSSVGTYVGLHSHLLKVAFNGLRNPLVVGGPVVPPRDGSPNGPVLAATPSWIVGDADRPGLVWVATISDQICNSERDSFHVHAGGSRGVVYIHFNCRACAVQAA